MSLSPAPLCTLVVNDADRILDADPVAMATLGWPRRSLVGAPLSKLITEALPTGGAGAVFSTRVLAGGSRRLFAQVAVSALLDGRRTVTIRETVADIDEQHRGFGSRLSDRLRRRPTPEAVAQEAVRAVGEQLRVDRVVFSKVHPSLDTARVVAMWTAADMPRYEGEHAFRAVLGEQVLAGYRRGETLVNEDARDDQRLDGVDRKTIERLLIAGVCTAPLLVEGELSAILSVHSRTRRAWSTSEVGLVEDAAERLAEALDRAEVEARLRESEEHFRTFAETLPGLAFVMDAQGQAYWWNKPHQEYFDSTDLGVIGHPADLERVQELWGRALAEGEPLNLEVRLRCKDGLYRPFHSYAVPVKNSDGSVARWCGMATDLSEVKEHERVQAFLLSFGEQLRAQSSPEAVLRTSSRLVGEYLQASRVGYGQIDDTGREVTIDHDWAAPQMPPLPRRQSYRDDDVSMSAYRKGATSVVEDFHADPGLGEAERAALAVSQIRATVTAPLLRQGRLVGIFAVCQKHPRVWTANEVALVEDVAERTWAAWERANAEARLRDSEALFRGLAENLPNLCWVADAGGAVLWGNRRWREFLAEDAGALRGDASASVHPEDWPLASSSWIEARKAGAPVSMVVRLRGPGGVYRPMLSQAEPILDEDGQVVRWCGIQTDLSEQYARDARQSFLLELGEALRRENDPVAILRLTSERLGRHMGVDRVVYGELDPFSGTIVSPCDWSAPDLDSMAGRHLKPTDDNWVIAGYRAGRTLASPDWAELEGTSENFRALHHAISATAFITAPLVKQGRLHGLFSVYDRRRRDWSSDDVSLVEEVGERTWEALWRARAEAASRASEEQFRTFAESLPDIAFVVDSDGAPLWWNRRHEELLGAGQGMGHIAVMCHPDERSDVMAAWGAALAAGEPIRAECRLMCADGRYRLFNAYAMPVKDSDGRVIRWCGLCRDVSEARARERGQDFLLQLGDTLRQSTDPETLLDVAAERLAAFLDVDLVGFVEANDEAGTVTIAHEAVNGTLPSMKGEVRLSEFGDSAMIAAFVAGRPAIVRDAEVEAQGDPALDGYRRYGVAATISFPILVDGRFRGVLYASSAKPRAWTDAEIDTTREVAERTWAAVERARSDSSRRDTEALLNAIMTNAPVGIYVKDLDGRYALMNAEMGRMLGQERERLIGHTAAEVLDPELAAHVAELDAQVLSTGQAIINERRMSEASGAPFHWTLSTRFPVQSRPGAPLQVAGINVDLTAQKLAEMALEKSREALHQSEKLTALGSLLAGVSHELNNPLSIVVAQAVMMERQAGDGGLAERARQIRAAADRCARIVQTFLAMARQKKPERRRTDLNAVVNTALELTAYGLRTSGVQLVRDQAENLPAISADADQLHQVIINLVINAQQAMQEQAAPRRLVVRTYPTADGASVALEIADSGPGVPDEMRRRIFEPFFTTKAQDVGTGVGLSFSQGLVEAHGGTLVLAESDGGATFRVLLPVSAAADSTIARSTQSSPGGPGVRTALVVDDEPQIARALAEFLELEGYRCETAFGGGDAKLMLKSADYDLIVSDLRMPDVDGPALFAWIKAERPDLARRVAFSTGDTLGAPAVRFLAREGRPFMEKPFTPETLRNLLDDLQTAS